MKKTIASILFVFLGSPAATGAQGIALFSYEDTSCGAWVQSANVVWQRAQYISWLRGFVSGYNFGNQGNQVNLGRMPNGDTLALFVDKYCRENPLNPFVSAAFKLVEELRERPEPPTSKGR